MSRARFIAGSLAALVAGCGNAAMQASGPGALTLSSIDSNGAPMALTDGQDVTLVEGAQGGFHVWMRFDAHGVPAGTVTMERTAHRLSDDQLVLRTMGDLTVGAPDAAGDWQAPNALPMFMCPSPVGLSVIDQPIVFRIALTDDAGNALADSEITLVPHCPAAEQAFCESICTG